MSAFVRAMAPDAPHPRDRHNIGGGTEAVRYRPVHPGMTAAERVLAGAGTQKDLEAVRAGSERHRAWLRSPDGRAWWAAQKWDRKGDIE